MRALLGAGTPGGSRPQVRPQPDKVPGLPDPAGHRDCCAKPFPRPPRAKAVVSPCKHSLRLRRGASPDSPSDPTAPPVLFRSKHACKWKFLACFHSHPKTQPDFCLRTRSPHKATVAPAARLLGGSEHPEGSARRPRGCGGCPNRRAPLPKTLWAPLQQVRSPASQQ